MKTLIKIIFLCLIDISCTKIPDVPNSEYTFGGGVLILNEGNFRSGNGSLSFFSYDSLKISNDLFYGINHRPLGDVPNSVIIKDDKAYIVVNNSGKIEVIDQSTLESEATINGLISPRNISIISDYKAYVTSMYSDSLVVINLQTNSISGYINLRRSSESIAIVGNKAYISNWVGGKELMVVNTLNNQVIDSIEVGIEPESMAKDINGNLWILCTGGWARDNFAELDIVNTSADQIEKKYVFPSLQDSPTSLHIDGFGMTLYYLDKGVRKMDISSDGLPPNTLISESGSYFYKIAINPINSDIFVTDAVDFMQLGYVSLYKNDGAFVTKQRAGIIPGEMCFKLRINTQTI